MVTNGLPLFMMFCLTQILRIQRVGLAMVFHKATFVCCGNNINVDYHFGKLVQDLSTLKRVSLHALKGQVVMVVSYHRQM